MTKRCKEIGPVTKTRCERAEGHRRCRGCGRKDCPCESTAHKAKAPKSQGGGFYIWW